MCGIFGWSLRRAGAPGAELLERATGALRHRGPDADGHWVGVDHGGFQIALGHRRLSIIDVATGAQPMSTHDGRYITVYNGEVYNFLELREELDRRGHVFLTRSDTEVVLEAYRAWGLGAFDRFRGMFALAIYDREEGVLILTRDHFGKKPLFLAQTSDGLIFSSEIEALLDFPGLSREIDPAAINSYLQQRYVLGPNTFFKSIQKLPPGCSAVVRHGECRVERYYSPPFASVSPDIKDFETAVEAFGAEFTNAVRLRMRSDVPVGAYLSGGLDSSAVVAEMSKFNTVKTFSIGFAEQAYSELPYAQDVSKLFATEHHEYMVTEEDFIANWSDSVIHRGAPISEPADIPIYLLSREASASIKVVLTGEGADELLGGYPKHRAEYLLGRSTRFMPSVLRGPLCRAAARTLPYRFRRAKTLLQAVSEPDSRRRLLRWFGSMSAADRKALFAADVEWQPADEFPFAALGASSTRASLFFDQTSWLPDNLLERADRMMMAWSIEGRMPFMDTALAQLVARFPDSFLVGGIGGKRVLRAAFKTALPGSVLDRSKVGFRVPVDIWFRGKLRPMLEEHLLSAESRTRSFCSPGVLQKLVSEHVGGLHNHEKALWGLLNLEIFLRAFNPDLSELMQYRISA